jgi:cytochrome P450
LGRTRRLTRETIMEPVPFHLQLYTPAGHANPHAIYARMRREQPIYHFVSPTSSAPVWLASRYDDCVSLLRDARLIKDDTRLTPAQRARYAPLIGQETNISRHLLRLDPPDHSRVRGLVRKAFSSQIVESLRPRIQEIIDELLDRVESAGRMDLIADFAVPLPVTVIAEMLGIPGDDRMRFRAWSQILTSTPNTPDGLQAKRTTLGEFAAYLQGVVAQRRAQPQADLISALLAANEQDDRLDMKEILGTLFLLLIAGHETTVHLIGNGMLALLEHPDQRQRLIDDPSLAGSAIEEMLRFDSPVATTTLRWSADEIEIRGTHIPAGVAVVTALIAANRDPEQFPAPDTFDIARTPNRHIAFGFGSHYCLGAHLARVEGALAVTTLLQRLPGLALATPVAALRWTASMLIHGVTAMPVTF